MKKLKIALLSTQKTEILGHIINKFIEYEINIESIKNNLFLKPGLSINKIDILFNKVIND